MARNDHRSYEAAETLDEGMLPVGEGHTIHWSVSGHPDGKPAVLLHGGPGGGSSPHHRRMFDPARYMIVQFDQRNCGRSTPHAGQPTVDLSANTTQHLIGDIERLRTMLGIDRWMVWGGSWGSTLALAYAQTHPDAVTEVLLTAVCSTNRVDVEWTTRIMGRVLPRPWQAFRDHLPPDRRDGNLPEAYHELLMDPDPEVHNAAALAWCRWEDHHMGLAGGFDPGLTKADPEFRLCFARLVTHYWAHAAFMGEHQLLDNAFKLDDIPLFMAHGQLDISSPVDFPVAMADAVTGAELLIAGRDGHGGAEMSEWAVSITDRLADRS